MGGDKQAMWKGINRSCGWHRQVIWMGLAGCVDGISLNKKDCQCVFAY